MLLNSMVTVICDGFGFLIALDENYVSICRGFGGHVLGDIDVTHACFVSCFQVQGRGTVQSGACLRTT